DIRDKIIVIELMGRHSNIILLDPTTDTILDGIHHVTPAISSHRIVLPGSRYVNPPDQLKADPLLTSKEQFVLIMSQDTKKKPQVDHEAALFDEPQEDEATVVALPL